METKFVIQRKSTGKYYVSTGIPSDWTTDKAKASVFLDTPTYNLSDYMVRVMAPNYGKCRIVAV
jgi:hypothetical protein